MAGCYQPDLTAAGRWRRKAGSGQQEAGSRQRGAGSGKRSWQRGAGSRQQEAGSRHRAAGSGKREADNRRILDALEKLAKTPIPAVPPANGENGPSGKQKSEPVPTERGYWYEIKREDKLSLIVQEYRKKGVKVTLQQVKDANPDVNPNRLLVGQKIWIPDASMK